ncbi:gliding motility lipoprotein GldH [Chitinophaga horti]|uniref:Gliding motility lipoprotein GldH n=1 Tax=Chitinophaga horti TaxID=2920382 RepID=A0ABY6IZB1_9BACT|nr:gliding motility lipoprotein GldH [Chitinophaga horti]UYQ92738.1 gliding motility lipoprotein GldH [Chitinophaga horti]
MFCKRKNIPLAGAVLGLLLSVAACKPPKLDTYEKNVEIPGNGWDNTFVPFFDLNIAPEDTGYFYTIHANVRHRDSYSFSNLWMMIRITSPDKKVDSHRVELQLADVTGKWAGSGTDDIFEHRVLINNHAIFAKPGSYRFSFQQNMRQNPLMSVMNVGLRIQKDTLRLR